MPLIWFEKVTYLSENYQNYQKLIDIYIYIISHFGCSVPIFWGITIGMNKDIDIDMNQDKV